MFNQIKVAKVLAMTSLTVLQLSTFSLQKEESDNKESKQYSCS